MKFSTYFPIFIFSTVVLFSIPAQATETEETVPTPQETTAQQAETPKPMKMSWVFGASTVEQDILSAMLVFTDKKDWDEVAHLLSLYRSLGSSEQAKVELTGLLEQKKQRRSACGNTSGKGRARVAVPGTDHINKTGEKGLHAGNIVRKTLGNQNSTHRDDA